MSIEPKAWCIGLVGYGEVGKILAEDLQTLGVARVLAYDVKLDMPLENAMRAHAKATRVVLADSPAALAAEADFIISAVTASQTVAVAKACAGSVKAGAWFLDFNSASPGAKQEAARLIDGAGGKYVEAAVMTSVPPYRIRVPLLLGGAHAKTLLALITQLGFVGEVSSDKIGVASATKMCRSVMIKGMEAMVIEAFTAARAYGVEDQVLASLKETFPGMDWETHGNYFFQRAIHHGRRRAEELRESAATVQEAGLTPWSASGTAERQAWVADLADSGLFGDKTSKRNNWRADADLILGARKK